MYKTFFIEFEPGNIYHVYNRGNNKQSIFFSEENYLFFLRKMDRLLKPHTKIMAYCLLSNHFHWMLYIPTDHGEKSGDQSNLNLQIDTLLSSYTKAINNRYNRTGSLFQQRTKAVAVETEGYALICFHYIHQNPLKAGLVRTMKDWLFSFYLDYCGDRNGTLVAKRFTFDMLNLKQKSIEESSRKAIDPDKIKKLF